MNGSQRLIVALDVPTHDEAIKLVDDLSNVAFFKVGLELLFAGSLYSLLERLRERRRGTGGIFVDLKLAGDIGNTVSALIKQSQHFGVQFITLVESVPFAITRATISAARNARGVKPYPQLLMVPYLSSLGPDNLRETGVDEDVSSYIVRRGKKMLDVGCDGLIVSGEAIGACRQQFGRELPIVSPGIRPEWASVDDHARATTPTEAIALGADYLVVGRPIRSDPQPRVAAQRVIDEIDQALFEKSKNP